MSIDNVAQDSPRPWRWTGKIATSSAGGGYAYVPSRVIIPTADVGRIGSATFKRLRQVGGELGDLSVFGAPADESVDVEALVGELRTTGIAAQPDHVFFAHPMYGNPMYGNPMYGNPMYGNPMYGNPMYGNPMYGNPMYGNPMYGNPMYGNTQNVELPKASSAVPAEEPDWYTTSTVTPTVNPRVAVIDSGLIDQGMLLGGWLPTAAKVDGDDFDRPDASPRTPDHWLDPVAGHGTFIAGIVDMYAPGCEITVIDRLEPTGACTESEIVDSINKLTAGAFTVNGKTVDRPDLLNLSFGGLVLDNPRALEAAIHKAQLAGIVVVASAGNDGTWRPSYPAALPGVISVGAAGPNGQAWFTNYGEWVRACAPGVDVVSGFFNGINMIGAPSGGQDPDEFSGWAKWNGSSFAAPRVMAALVREMRLTGCTARQAVERVVDAPHLARLPGLGTVVNL